MCMWCDICKEQTIGSSCPKCGAPTEPYPPVDIYWCEKCKTPIIENITSENHKCPLCGNAIHYLGKDLRPVFPEERLLIEILLGHPMQWKDSSVWANNSRYYIDGKVRNISMSQFKDANIPNIINQLSEYKDINSYEAFNKFIKLFVEANRQRLIDIKNEAYEFINLEAAKYRPEQLVISFSGGKDSTVVADLVVRALSNPSIVHIYGDTTLEFPTSYDYVTRFRKDNPKAILRVAKNKDQDFYSVCEDIGPPARMMRWCCTMFKTGPITRVLNSLYRDEHILTFYGIRKCESAARSKYDRVSSGADVKIQKQTVASPIFYWNDVDIWLYMLGEDVDFNDAYRLGYDRVGCWCCPNNNVRAQFLSQIYMPEQYKRWRDYLISFARSIGKPDAEEYVDGGWWKARQGGNGLESAEDVKIKFTNCTAEENAKIYNLNKQVDDEFYDLFVPFGKVSRELGRKLINEVIVLDLKSNVPIISIQPFSLDGYEHAVKIKTMNVKSHEDLQRMIGYQIRKYNACRKCLKCESVCDHNAITITKEHYRINPNKCKRCKKCVSAKFLDGGCLMDRFLKVKKEEE